MKKVVISVFFILSTLVSTFAQVPSSEEVLNKAFAKAKKEKKKVLLIFHASWCGWCKKMEKAIVDKSCKDFFEKNYVITYLTVLDSEEKNNKGSSEVLKKYGGENSGLPYWVILDEKGTLLEDSKDSNGENVGCPAEPNEVETFIEKLKKTSKINQKQIASVRQRFLKNRM